MKPYRPPLHVYVIQRRGETGDERHAAWAAAIQEKLTGSSESLSAVRPDIPVYVWASADAPPPDLPAPEADRVVLLFVVTDRMVASPEWRAWASRNVGALRADDIALTAALTPHFVNLGPSFQNAQAFRLWEVDADRGLDDLLLHLTHAIGRALTATTEPVRLFLSHAKRGTQDEPTGRDLALQLKQYVDSRPAGTIFFDEVSISGGAVFADAIDREIARSIVVIILTDLFSSRYWCDYEVVKAKCARRPMLVVNAITDGEALSLPYAGNVPTIRWDPQRHADNTMHRRIITAAMLELVRSAHHRARVEAVAGDRAGESIDLMGSPPELATLPRPRDDKGVIRILHPDPPLATFRRELIQMGRPDILAESFTQSVAHATTGGQGLDGLTIALSISGSPDLQSLGMTASHVDRFWTDLVTHLLASGAGIAYGGDLRTDGFTAKLLDLATSRATLEDGWRPASVHWYAGWPIAARLDDVRRASFPPSVALHEFGPPPGFLPDAVPPSGPPDPVGPTEIRLPWTAAMTAMRTQMARDCDARVLLGGQLRAVAPWPGLLEELVTSASIGRPVYVVGCFGGAAAALLEVIAGRTPPALTRGAQDAGRGSLEDDLARLGLPRHVDEMLARLVRPLPPNGLDASENATLATSRDPVSIISLILRGLAKLPPKRPLSTPEGADA